MTTMDDLKQQAQDFIRQLDAGDFSGATQSFDSTMVQAFPEAKVKETWAQLTGAYGPYQALLKIGAAEMEAYRIITLTCQFEKTTVSFRVVYNQSGQISGFNIQLDTSATPYHPPEYVHAETFHEIEVTVGSGAWALPGTLTLPQGDGPFPAAVLVHGSGPHDQDETIGPNKPFRDLAWGLASQGVAVLRYEKRTKAYSARFTPEVNARLTDQEEVIDDALLAVRLLRQTPGIDPRRIYVLGHSLGATLAPRIGQQDPGIAGLVIMGGITRTLEDTILGQFTYLYSLAGAMTDAHKAELEELKIKVARVKSLDASGAVPAKDLPLGIQPAYWLSLHGYHPDEVAKKLDMRIFVLQGGRDYQVTLDGDFPAWQKALGGKNGAALKVYPSLFHLFIPGEGPSTPNEYMVEGHVSGEVIEDIAEWIKQ